MLLAIDVGNTNVSLGVFRVIKDAPKQSRSRISSHPSVPPPQLIASWRLATSVVSTSDEYGTKILDFLHYATIPRVEIKAVAVASVVPPLNGVFEELAFKYFKIKPYLINERSKIPLSNLYENPKEVGADRIVDSVAAYVRFGGPVIVVDFGTATTFDCVTKKGEYAGGVIVPGPALASESLSQRTANLPRVEIAKPDHLIGKNTVESIQSGLYYGYISLVDGIIDRLKSELGSGTKIVSTGGLASLIAGGSKHVRSDLIQPDLTLEGIHLVWERNT